MYFYEKNYIVKNDNWENVNSRWQGDNWEKNIKWGYKVLCSFEWIACFPFSLVSDSSFSWASFITFGARESKSFCLKRFLVCSSVILWDFW